VRLNGRSEGTSEGDRLDVFVTLVEAYEARRWAIDPPDPIDAIRFRLEQRGLSRRYLQKILGSSDRVSEIMNRKRSLSIEMMRRLHEELNIPAGSFLRRPTTKRGAGPRVAKHRRKTAQGLSRAGAALWGYSSSSTIESLRAIDDASCRRES
jgi:HTH-type transcriptional regulator/antitoxin HigA